MTIIRSGYAPKGQTNRRAYGYDTQHWQRTRKARLAIDNHQCTLQLNGCTHKATTVHLNPELNGNHRHATTSNTQSACLHCHSREHGMTSTNRRA